MNKYRHLFSEIDQIYGRPTHRNKIFRDNKTFAGDPGDESDFIAQCYNELFANYSCDRNIDLFYCRRNYHCLDFCLQHLSFFNSDTACDVLAMLIKCFIILPFEYRFNNVNSMYSKFLRYKYVASNKYNSIQNHIDILSRCLHGRFEKDIEEQNIDTQLLSFILLFNDDLDFFMPLFTRDMNEMLKKNLSEFILQLNEFEESGDSVIVGLAVISGSMLASSKLLDSCHELYDELELNQKDFSPRRSDILLLKSIDENRGLYLRDIVLNDSVINYALKNS